MEAEATSDPDDGKSLELKYNEIKNLKEQLERDFGQKRARFKQIYLECEANLNQEKEARSKAEAHIQQLEKKIEDLQSENVGVRTAAQLSEEAIREEIQALKVKHQEELASLQHIWQEGVKEAQVSMSHKFEEEKNALWRQNQMLEQQMKELQSKQEEGKDKSSGEGLISMMSQAIRRNTTSPLPSKDTKEEAHSDSLEHSMKKAQEDAEAWRSIVMPLEQQISSLRSKLKEANEKLKQYETKEGVQEGSTESLKHSTTDDLQEKAKELQNYLDAERSSRTDLEMFVAVLNTQKGVLQEDADKLRRELHNVCRLLEQEKMAHRELKQTWKMANDQFLEQQTLLSKEIEQMRRIMTPPQLEKLSKEMRHRKAQPIKTVAEEPYTLGKGSQDDLITFEDSPKKRQKPVSLNEIEIKTPNESLRKPEDKTAQASPASRIRQPSESARSLEEGEELKEDDDGLRITPKEGPLWKSNSSTDLQEMSEGFTTPVKSLSQGDLTDNRSKLAIDDISASWVELPSPASKDIEDKLHLNETGWSTMKESHSVSQFCMMCQNYEKQLQRLQAETTQLQARNDSLHSALKREKETNTQEKEKVASLEQSINVLSEEMSVKIEECSRDQIDAQNELVQIQQEFACAQQEMLSRLQDVSEDRDRILAEMESIQEEQAYRNSMGQFGRDGPETLNLAIAQLKYKSRISQDQSQATTAKPIGDNTALTNQLQALKATSDRKEEELRSEIMFLKDRVMAEQYDRENMEKLLQQELDEAREEIAKLKSDLVSPKLESTEENIMYMQADLGYSCPLISLH